MPISKIIKFGKGAAIIIPPEYLKERKLKVGDVVDFEVFKIPKNPDITEQIMESEKNIAKGKIKKLKV